jgi:hypothetical protein
MVNKEIFELVAVGVQPWLLAEAVRVEEGERLEGSQGGLALRHRWC